MFVWPFDPLKRAIYGEESNKMSILPDSILFLLNDLGVKNNQKELIGSYLSHVKNEPFIQKYIDNTLGITHGYSNVKVVETFEINRPEDSINFQKNLKNRRLLWHGTKKKNIGSIIHDGFNLKFSTSDRMFGKGVYFADCFTKSLNYCQSFFVFSRTSHDYLFLCEVALGEIMTRRNAYYTNKNLLTLSGKNSVKGEGEWTTSKGVYKDGVMIRPGKLKQRYIDTDLMYNEFVVYDTNQIQFRYLVKVVNVQPIMRLFINQVFALVILIGLGVFVHLPLLIFKFNLVFSGYFFLHLIIFVLMGVLYISLNLLDQTPARRGAFNSNAAYMNFVNNPHIDDDDEGK